MKGASDFQFFRKGFAVAAVGLGAIGVVCGLVAEPASAAADKILHAFGAWKTDGQFPDGGLFMDAKGNLYGATVFGGSCAMNASGCGVVWELSPPTTTGGAWKETVLHNFGAWKTDGQNPRGALIMDAKGNLYGTTQNGGSCSASSYGCGTAFELSPPATTGGAWKETRLHNFGAWNADGQNPIGALIMDAKGNLYGTTYYGGGGCLVSSFGCGTAFELSPPAAAGGAWKETILHSFSEESTDGQFPADGLIMDAKGHLYGTTYLGGGCLVSAPGCGMAFVLNPPAASGGAWKETRLHSFGAWSSDGLRPMGGLILDAKGNLYGTAYYGGVSCSNFSWGCGKAFELSPPATTGGPWKETVLHNFGAWTTDGTRPNGALMMDAKGNLYGTAYFGGSCANSAFGCGTMFELSPPATTGGTWKEKGIHNFGAWNTDGQNPEGPLLMDAKGNLYGTTYYGGACSSYSHGCGTIFEMTP